MSDKNTPDNSFNHGENLENLSALVDGEAGGDFEGLLHNTSCDDACKAVWQRYHLVRDVMQRDYNPVLGCDFAGRIAQQIANEDNLLTESVTRPNVVSFADKKAAGNGNTVKAKPAQSSTRRRSWLPVAGLGLAASVAAAGFVAWQLTQTPDTTSPIEVAQITETQQGSTVPNDNGASVNQPLVLVDAIVPTVYKQELGTRWLATTSEPRNEQVEKRLNSLLINHLEDSTMGRVQGMLAHSRVVAYDSVPVNESF